MRDSMHTTKLKGFRKFQLFLSFVAMNDVALNVMVTPAQSRSDDVRMRCGNSLKCISVTVNGELYMRMDL